MKDHDKTTVRQARETLLQQTSKDLGATAILAFCVCFSNGSAWWTFVTVSMISIFLFRRVSTALERDGHVRLALRSNSSRPVQKY